MTQSKPKLSKQLFPDLSQDEIRLICFIAFFGEHSVSHRSIYCRLFHKSEKTRSAAEQRLLQLGLLQTNNAVSPDCYLDALDVLAEEHPDWLKDLSAMQGLRGATHSAQYLRKLADLVRNDDFEAAASLPKPYEGLGKKIFNVYPYLRKRALQDARYATMFSGEQMLTMTTETLYTMSRQGTIDMPAIESIRRMFSESHPQYAELIEQTVLYEYLLTGHCSFSGQPRTQWALSMTAIRELYAGHVEDALALFRKAVKIQKPKNGCLPSPILNYFYAICIIKYRQKYGLQTIGDVLNELHSATPVRVGTDNFAPRMLLEYAEISTEDASNDVQRRAGMVLEYISDNLDKCMAMLTIKFFALPDSYSEKLGHPQPAMLIMQHEMSPYLVLGSKTRLECERAYGGKPLLASMRRKASWELMLSEIGESAKSAVDDRPRRIIYFMQGRTLSCIMEQAQETDGEWKDTSLLSVMTMCSTGYDSMDLIDSRIAMELNKKSGNAPGSQYVTDADIVIPILAGTGRVFVGKEYVADRMQADIIIEAPYVEFLGHGDKISISSNVKTGYDGKPQKYTVLNSGNTYTLISINPLQRDILGKLLVRQALPTSAAPTLRKTIDSLGGILEVRENITSMIMQKAFESNGKLAVRIVPTKKQEVTEYNVTFLALLLPEGLARLEPAVGEEYVYDEDVAGRTHYVHRNMLAESDNYQALVDFAEDHQMEFRSYNTLSTGNDRTLLGLLAFCHRQQDRYVTEWPNGQMLKFKGLLTENDINIEVRSNTDWFAVEGQALVGTDVLKLEWLIKACCNESYDGFVRIGENEYIKMTDTLRRHIAQLDAILTMGDKKTKAVPKYLVGALAKAIGGLRHDTDDGYRNFRDRMKAAYRQDIPVPAGLRATLRQYQEEGFRWMARLDAWGAGACLADDMGLGKTLQSITFMLCKADKGPSIVVAPKSVIPNWVNEVQRFAPQLGIAVLNDAADRKKLVSEAGSSMVILTTYGVLTTEAELLASRQWNVVCLDEAQQIKNRNTMVSRAAMGLKAVSRIVLTGTPLQNHVGELWNLMQFINPGLLGRWNVFRDTYVNGEMDEDHREMLKEMVQPFILRRTKEEVLTDLPEKIESTYYVTQSEDEHKVYETMRQRVELKFKKDKTKEERAMAKAIDASYFDELMKLRLASCDMHLIYDRWKKQSTKVEALMEILKTLMENPANNILVFSQFTSFLAIIKPELDRHEWAYHYMDGQTPMEKRQTMVEEFQLGKKRIFVSSLKAGSLGINLTRANYVILLDPWWNPAIEQQAADRAHRIGQQRCVSVIRLICEHTIEEKILRLHEKKQSLSDDVLDGTADSYKLNYDDILEMVAPF